MDDLQASVASQANKELHLEWVRRRVSRLRYGTYANTSQPLPEWLRAWLHQACLLLLACSK